MEMLIFIWLDVGLISFLVFCCVLPTACVYYRHRRNARALEENFFSIQSRLAEIERRRNEGSDDSNLQEENSQKDWECLEQLFGPIPIRSTEENDNEADNNEASQLQIIMLDILIFLGYTGHIDGMGREQERQRKRERGRRLVNALKETSMSVRECLLIAKGDAGSGDDSRGQDGVDRQTGSLDGSVEGDIELGRMMTCDQNNNCNVSSKIGSEEDGSQDTSAKYKQNDLEVESGDGSTLATSNMSEPSSVHSSDSETNINENSKASLGVTGSQVNGASLESATATSDPPVSTNSDTNNPQTVSSGDDSPPPAVDVAVSTTVPPPQQYHSSNSSSLYDMDDDPYDDDGDNKYSALCVNCAHSPLDAAASLPPPQSTNTTTTTNDNETRLVSTTCAICLIQYAPGCYVSWSSNKECKHAFHRDCILMWLLKKEELLCPCCRRVFVSESALNGDVDDENNTGDVGNNAGSGE